MADLSLARNAHGSFTTREARLPLIITYVFLIIGAIVMIMPFVWMISTSVKPDREIFGDTIRWIPTELDLQNYSDAFKQTNMPRIFANTIVVTAVAVASQVLLGSMAGYVFARLHFRGKMLIFFALLTTMMVPFEVLIIPVFLLIKFFPLAGGNDILGQGGTGLINTLGGVMFPNFVSVFGVFLFRQFYLSFPKEIEEAAIVDGCSRIGVYWRILVPNSKPVMGTMALFAFLWSWNDFLWPLVVVKEDSLKTIQLGLSVFDQEQGTAWAELMAASVMAVVPVILLYIFLQRFLVSGGITSGIKG
ncbi:MAG: carbohydrate ABC transporter permease [Chloroflexota bacterium]|nr:carbohydrate ABC transporter permease [Chloroflexota bacterium]MDE2948756.1 carbohydrate ABC transporter permease [Chloroflexota bacterium]